MNIRRRGQMVYRSVAWVMQNPELNDPAKALLNTDVFNSRYA